VTAATMLNRPVLGTAPLSDLTETSQE
jgi:hypothetical protein